MADRVPVKSPSIKGNIQDPVVGKALDEIHSILKALITQPFTNCQVISGVELEDGVVTKVKHGLGKKYALVIHTPVKNPSTVGMIQELAPDDPSREVWLQADGYGATVTVNLIVS